MSPSTVPLRRDGQDRTDARGGRPMTHRYSTSHRTATRAGVAALALALAAAPIGASGVARLVKDLRTLPTGSSYFQGSLAELPDAAFVLGGLPDSGREPWRTDGTAAGTRLLRNLAPGHLDAGHWILGRAGGAVLFSAWTPATGVELWASDGSAAGTVQVANLRPGREGSFPRPLGALGGWLIFAADDGVHGVQVFRSDGTAAGTLRLSDLGGGVCRHPWQQEEPGSTLAGRVYFAGDDGVHGCELWATDATAGGTVLVEDLVPGAVGGNPEQLFAAGGRLYFAAEDAAHGVELWVSEGTAPTTRRVTDLVPGANGSYPAPLGAANGGLVFAALSGDFVTRPYWTDGGAGAPVLLADVWSGGPGAEVGGRVVFVAEAAAHGAEPWTTDGTPAGTALLADLRPGPAGSIRGFGFGVASEGAYFIARDGLAESALYRTDGTAAGTARVGATGPAESVSDFAEVGASALFQVSWWETCGPHDECEYLELWTTDGTEPGTQRLWSAGLDWSSSDPSSLAARPGGVVFGALTDEGSASSWERRAHRSDGTEAGTVELATPGGDPFALYRAAGPLPGGELVLAGHGGDGVGGLWRLDGDVVSLVRPGPPGSGPEEPSELTKIGDLVFFGGSDATTGTEPWRTDGTAAGTFRLQDIVPAAEGSYPSRFTDVFGQAWFEAGNAAYGRELWESNGTIPGTLVHDLTPGPDGTLVEGAVEIVPFDEATGTLLFRSYRDLYAYTPGAGGATPLHTFSDGLTSLWSQPVLVALGGEIYFVDAGGPTGCALRATDGTLAGTRLVAPIGYGWAEDFAWDPCPATPVAFAGRLWFTACENDFGCELWTSDGTGAGTHRFADLEPGAGSLLPTDLTPIGDRLYFAACREASGCEPWLTDGSAAGTHRLADLAPGALSSRPGKFTLSESLVYFAADDGTGSELWAMPTELFYDGFETGDAARWDPPTP
ncbi:MAG: hypothetical protein F9K18_04480 [Thermoanaerobaculia bacterium]|nr:MAG: hypothetical protein F9K18_04480 [Thermoanaerobaculia bacterium]